MSFEFVDLFFNFLKVLFVLAGIIYVIFSIVAIRQIDIMENSLVTSLAGKLKMLGYLHFVIAVLALIYFIVAL